ncbi:hypothetical protein [Runella slithyformis]|uniref:Uncharacterized protein n=1 Tax=Runella slithyformis (strain ATCC 29530 / DSM 19594 / LMG 11500 / NCIMB 11436 / LSU 4) TaxID=761193 RepID=A0A7U3ZQ89_RUNSL|nr:hypothetical protein [Runella slithyformis]AEI51377.1 hypothetical protein Runsl_5071 [Runella slithyformis DSM 19594]
MANIPFYVYATFGITLFSTLYLFYRAIPKSNGFIVLISIWLLVQSIIGILGFYTITNTMPPRFQLLLLPPLVFTMVQFSTKKGKAFIDSLDLKILTIIHIVRIPVEIVLYWLFVSKAVPELVTFEGRNFDIISGISAPFIYYFGFVKQKIGKPILIAWNIICLGLLLNIVINGMLSAPTPFQQFGLEQPNIAVLHFPFMFLPACIVPIILFSHLSSIRQLVFNKSLINKS